jgi:hypothetical protein
MSRRFSATFNTARRRRFHATWLLLRAPLATRALCSHMKQSSADFLYEVREACRCRTDGGAD